MSLLFATQLTAIATAVLAVFAIVTAWYARWAFLKQSQEVRAIERQVQDAQELTRQQAELLRIQSGQLDLQRQQFDDQRADAVRHGGARAGTPGECTGHCHAPRAHRPGASSDHPPDIRIRPDRQASGSSSHERSGQRP